ncbi:MAG: DUF6498-containing protein [Planctomycetota bacterium]
MTETTRNKRTRLSALALIVANLVPLVGVAAWGWSLGELLAIYWAESAVIGILNVFKMLRIGGVRAIPLCLFFCVHFGGFMIGHAVFLGVFFLAGDGGVASILGAVMIQVAVLFLSHFISFLVHWVSGPEKRATSQLERTFALSRQMFAPYKRIIVMHITILLGGGPILMLGAPQWALYLFVVLKLGVDLAAHVKEHNAFTRLLEAVPPHTSVR